MKEKKKLAFVNNSAKMMYNFRLNVMKNCVEGGYEVTVVATADFDVSLFSRYGIRFINIDVDPHGTNPLKDIKLMFQLRKIYLREKFDFIFHYTIKPVIYGEMAARMSKIPSISVITGLGQVFANEMVIMRLVERMYKIAFRHANEVWFLNNDDKNMFLERNIVDESKVRVLPGEGVSAKTFAPQFKHGKDFSFLYFGRLLPEKGIFQLVEAARQIHTQYPDVKFSLLGTFDELSEITPDLVATWEKEGVVQYLGQTMNVVPFLRETDCVVLPSYYREGVPRSLMEAAAMELPLIATDAVGCRDIVKDGVNGFLCKIKDVPSLVEAMKKILNMTKQERKVMGKAGRQMVLDNFEDQIIIKIYKNTLNKYI